MQRILVIGPCGAGKSFVSRRLGEALRLPVVHLDAEYFLPNWLETDPESWKRRVAELIARPLWIMDGSHLTTLPQRLGRADTVILLDLPTWLCFSRILRRIATTYGRVRPDMAEGCPERLDCEFLGFALRYRRDQLPRILGELEQFDGCIVRLGTRRAIDRFVTSLPEREMLTTRAGLT